MSRVLDASRLRQRDYRIFVSGLNARNLPHLQQHRRGNLHDNRVHLFKLVQHLATKPLDGRLERSGGFGALQDDALAPVPVVGPNCAHEK